MRGEICLLIFILVFFPVQSDIGKCKIHPDHAVIKASQIVLVLLPKSVDDLVFGVVRARRLQRQPSRSVEAFICSLLLFTNSSSSRMTAARTQETSTRWSRTSMKQYLTPEISFPTSDITTMPRRRNSKPVLRMPLGSTKEKVARDDLQGIYRRHVQELHDSLV